MRSIKIPFGGHVGTEHEATFVDSPTLPRFSFEGEDDRLGLRRYEVFICPKAERRETEELTDQGMAYLAEVIFEEDPENGPSASDAPTSTDGRIADMMITFVYPTTSNPFAYALWHGFVLERLLGIHRVATPKVWARVTIESDTTTVILYSNEF